MVSVSLPTLGWVVGAPAASTLIQKGLLWFAAKAPRATLAPQAPGTQLLSAAISIRASASVLVSASIASVAAVVASKALT